MSPIRLFVIHRSRLLRDALRGALETGTLGSGTVEVVGSTPYINEGLRRLRGTATDIVLLDADAEDCRVRIRQLRNTFPSVKVLPIGVEASEAHVLRCIEAGACGFVTADTALPELVKTLELIREDRSPCSPDLAAAVVRRIAELAQRREELGPAAAPAALTSREMEVLQAMDAGLRNKEIASRLEISLSTVKNHVHRILEKLGASRRSSAIQEAYERGLLSPDPRSSEDV